MKKHSDAVVAAFAGFVLTGVVMVPPVLAARAEKAARIAAYEQVLGPDTTNFDSDSAGRLASLLRNAEHGDEAQPRLIR